MLKVIEEYAGISAWIKAMSRLGIPYKVVAAIEKDEKTVQSYNYIHNSNFTPSDITEINFEELPDCDIIFYSPPCQSFSLAGNQEGFKDPRGTLFFESLKSIRAKKPKYAIMENVKNLAGNKFKFEFETMLQLLEQEGYRNYWSVLNAKDYGIPQNRERVFIVSIRNDVEVDFEFPEGFDNGIRVQDLIEHDVDEKYYLKLDKILYLESNNKLESIVNKEISNTIRSGGRNSLDRHSWDLVFEETKNNAQIVLKDHGKWKIKTDNISTCIDANYFKGVDNHAQRTMIYRSGRIRRYTPLECFRLMGFDDADYHVLKANKVSDTQIYKMAGNSIVVDVIEAILKNLVPQYINTNKQYINI